MFIFACRPHTDILCYIDVLATCIGSNNDDIASCTKLHAVTAITEDVSADNDFSTIRHSRL